MKVSIKLILLFVCLCYLSLVASARKKKVDTYGRLVTDLLTDYVTLVKPTEEINGTLEVSLGISLIYIKNLNLADQTLEASFWFRMVWTDYRLSWDPEDYGGITELKIPAKSIWTPDLMIYNGEQGTQGSINLQADVNVVIKHDGTVLYMPPLATKTLCHIDKKSDVQVCSITVGSWTFDGISLNLILESSEIDLSSYTSSREWNLQDSSIVRNIKMYQGLDVPYIDVRASFTLRHIPIWKNAD